ncbi:hypothetical protein GTQ40_17780 [Flavobacteriaceae bacterium R38]|nr:hypothetical protein [Flavobacteriaceae bacterium R38]
MKRIIRYIFLSLTGLSLICCNQKKFDSEEALWTYMKDEANQYVQHKSVNGVDFSLIYKPTDLLVKQELVENASREIIDSLRARYGQYLYFNLTMSKNDHEILTELAGNQIQFGNMVNQLAFGMTEKIHLYTPQKDTIPMQDYIYPRMYGMSNNTSILLVYPRDSQLMKQDHFNLSIEDLGLFTGEVSFKVPVNLIKKQPQLNF